MRDRKTGFCLGDRYRVAYCLSGPPTLPPFRRTLREGRTSAADDARGHLDRLGRQLQPAPRGPGVRGHIACPGRYVLVHRVNLGSDFLESGYTDNVASMALRPQLAPRPEAAAPNRRRRPLPATATCP